ncbi:MAG: hypothetical protein IPI43_03455 [Sandaracinaceae bacterium]|nr:hypothetical protein [Sandaracinaceae bacterium]
MGADHARADLDLSLWPLVIFTVREGMKASDYFAVFARYEAEVFTRHERYVSITNLSMLDGVPGAQDRKAMAEWMGKHADYVGRWALGNSTVIRSAVVRGALTALYWVQKPPTPQTAHGTLWESIEWGLSTLDQAGIARPTGVEAWYAAKTQAGRGAA